MFQNLNDNCLYKICKLISLEEQFSMLNSNDLFIPVIKAIWRQKYKKVDLNKLTYFRYAEKKKYKYFMAVIRKSIQELRIHQRVYDQNSWRPEQYTMEKDWLERLSCLSTITFPQLKVLSCSADYDLPTAIDLGKMFPALERFDLFYFHNPNVKTANLVKSIKTIVNCKMISELCMNGEFFCIILDDILTNLPRLRKISATRNTLGYVDCELITRLAGSSVCQRIHTLKSVRTFKWLGMFQCLANFSNLRYFTMKFEDDLATLDDDVFSQLLLFMKNFKQKMNLNEFELMPLDDCYKISEWNDYRPFIRSNYVPHYVAVSNIDARSSLPHRNRKRLERYWNRRYMPKTAFHCEWDLAELSQELDLLSL